MSLDPIFIRLSGVSGFDTTFLFGLFAAISMPIFIQLRDKRGVVGAVRASGWPVVLSGSCGSGNLTGDALAFFSVACVSVSQTLLRKYQGVSRMASVGMGGLFLAIVMVFLASPSTYSTSTWIIMGVIGLITAPEVGIVLMIKAVLAPFFAFGFFAEIPPMTSFIGGAIILLTILIYALVSAKQNQ